MHSQTIPHLTVGKKEGSYNTQWEVGVKILKHLCVSVTKVQAHLLSTFSIELIAIVLTVNRCTELK